MDVPIVTRREDALTFTTAPTDVMRFLALGDHSSPDVYVERLAPGDGPPLHRHPWVTWEVVVEGRLRALVGDDTHELGAGDLLFTPPDVPHTFMAIGDTEAQIVGINWPGGFHHLYAELAPLFHTGGPPDFAALAAAAARHGAEILGPPLAQLEAAGG
jgi:mannose-6-phosphate isomerase-like protein (cupin superfamily)